MDAAEPAGVEAEPAWAGPAGIAERRRPGCSALWSGLPPGGAARSAHLSLLLLLLGPGAATAVAFPPG